MQDGFFQKLLLSLVAALCFSGLIEFYKTFVDGAEQALNGKHGKTHFNAHPPAKP